MIRKKQRIQDRKKAWLAAHSTARLPRTARKERRASTPKTYNQMPGFGRHLVGALWPFGATFARQLVGIWAQTPLTPPTPLFKRLPNAYQIAC